MDFAKILNELRTANNMSQQELAQKLNINQSNISNWERGINRPEYEKLVSLADIFGVTVDELLGREGH